MTASERRQIGRAIREYDCGRDAAGRAILAALARDYTPERETGTRYLVETPVGYRAMTPTEALSQPKPRKRLVDRKALKEYVRTHPECEVIGCEASPCPEPHHLISRKMKGDDVPSNLLRLCFMHHAAWHRNGPKTWLVGYGNRLTADTRSKVAAALRIA